MRRSLCSNLSSRTLNVRDETAAVVDRLVDLVRQCAGDVGQCSRHTGAAAQGRATSAVLALRGKRTPPRWPWLVTGLAVGAVVGAVTGAALARRWPTPAGETDLDVSADGSEPPADES